MLFLGVIVGCTTTKVYAESLSAADNNIYVFKDAKKDGTITFVKKWKDGKNNSERPVPDIEISTQKPQGEIAQYMVTFHGNGLLFANGAAENAVIYNSSGQILSGNYLLPEGIGVCWYLDKECTQRINVSNDGTLNINLTQDINLYAKETTFIMKTGQEINDMIPDKITQVIFTNECEPADTEILDFDADGDGGVFAWAENNTLNISSGITGRNIIANTDCSSMFKSKAQLINIDFSNIDFSQTTSMGDMFNGCERLEAIDLSNVNTAMVTDMGGMFFNCAAINEIDVSTLNTKSLKNMQNMFYGCSSLRSMDISMLETSKVTNMSGLFMNCRNIKSINMHGLDTKNVTGMSGVFSQCRNLTDIDITGIITSKVTNFSAMFTYCTSLTKIDLSEFDLSSAGNLNSMFYGCINVTELDFSTFNTSNNPQMVWMLGNCKNLTKLILGENFAFRGNQIGLTAGTWQNSDGETFTSDGAANDIPEHVADTYIKIS